MEQISNGLLSMIQAAAEYQATAASGAADRSDQTGSFRKLLEDKRSAQPDERAERETRGTGGEDATAENAGKPAAVQEDPELELQKQMALTGWLLMGNLVVPTEGTQPPACGNIPEGSVGFTALEPMRPAEEPLSDARLMTGGIDEKSQVQVQGQERQIRQAQTPELRQEAGDELHTQRPLDGSARQNQQDTWEQRLDYGGETPVFQEVRDVFIKVAEADGTEPAGEYKPVNAQLGEGLERALQSGETKVELQLEPENLGRVQVEMTWDREGALHVSMYAENSHTRSLLERDLSGLQQLLGRNTQQEVHVEVAREQESQQQNFQDGRGGEQSGHRQHERRQEHRQSGEDFLQQLRLGLTPLNGAAS